MICAPAPYLSRWPATLIAQRRLRYKTGMQNGGLPYAVRYGRMADREF
jgi:hypothetical protein